ncbi:MAG: hypothetical protein NTV43_06400 [Methylococcales bacterium]|nr:hypothetical protein [Methylococcales bacterium]
MIALVFSLLFLPVCAILAGLIVWAKNYGQTLDDSDLIRDFLVTLLIWALIAWGASRTDAVRIYLDPQFRLQTELDAHPVYATLKRVTPDDHKQLHNFLLGQLTQGATLPEAFVQARPLLTWMTNHHLGFSDQEARVAWGQVTVDALKELQANTPNLCYIAIAAQRLEQQATVQAFSADNALAFQQAVVGVYESGSRYHERTSNEPAPEFDDAAREYRVIDEAISQRFGEDVTKQLDKKQFPQPPMAPAEQICAARIYQLEAMLERPQAMAATLLDSVLR